MGSDQDFIDSYLVGAKSALQGLLERPELQVEILQLAANLAKVLREEKIILWCGNGGSAAEAQHLAAELVGRFELDGRPLRSLALTTDSSVVTAIGNDYGYDQVFSRQVRGIARPGDVLIAMSTSGESASIIRALQEANQMGVMTVLLTGANENSACAAADISLRLPATRTCHIQELHLVIGQMLCGLVERELRKE